MKTLAKRCRARQRTQCPEQFEFGHNSSTEWTKLGKPAEQSEFKEGSFVIVLGHADKEGRFYATRIDLRLPR